MKKKKSNRVFDSKIFWMIMSLLLAVAMWTYVTSQTASDTVVKRTLSGIVVEFEGQEELREQSNLTITNVSDNSVSLVVSGSRSVLGNLSSNNIKAVIKVTNITEAGDYTWTYEPKFPSSVNTNNFVIIGRSPETISFSVVKNIVKTVSVKGSFGGTIADGCVAEEVIFDPATIAVEGPEDILSTIDYALVNFGSGSIDASYSEEAPFVLIDKSGNKVSSKDIRFSTTLINATQPILKSKEIPLTVEVAAGGGLTEEDCKITVSPEKLKIAGDTRILDTIDSVVLGTVDLSDIQSDTEKTFTVKLADKIQNLTGATEAKVKISLPKTYTKSFTTGNISCKNVSDGYSATIDTKELEILLRAKNEDVLSKITAEDITVEADLTDFGTTTGQVIAVGKAYINGYENVGAVGDIRVTVTISKD